ncbi:hypothetical protein [Streptantibioticus silvisoli]|uniref:ATP-grasp domain-containing protein n=1 Tax=Streptantibioticus silvisoli TaxID=2705255 RepID=A0ABT6VV63_9ACTN|nr:hypothetical protein [Streptantibioticus silvisoli]MDI5962362.1 hypothetical protein [Streptantibioticus silvisoli]
MTDAALVLGTFGAEQHWRPEGMARLPGVRDPRAVAWVAAMDELLVLLTRPGDTLATRRPLSGALREVLAHAGITFAHQLLPQGPAGASAEALAAEEPFLTGVAAGHHRLEPFAVLPDTVALAQRMGLAGALPAADVAARVNGKLWSNACVRELGLPGQAYEARGSAEVAGLVERAARVTGAVLVKDPFGVAGQGTLEIGSAATAARLTRHLRRQEEAGCEVRLLVQPRWERRWDFSAHLEIARDGTARVVGVQHLRNQGYRHAVSGPLPAALAAELRGQGYAAVLTAVAERLAGEGWFGPVCVDSMVCADGMLVPVLEVNARQSLGRLNLRLNDVAGRRGLESHLWQEEIALAEGEGIDQVLAALAGEGLLYTGGSEPGVLPLSGGCLTPPRGRLCCAVLCPPGAFDHWAQRVRRCLATARSARTDRVPAR